jgi:hypothetical protein
MISGRCAIVLLVCSNSIQKLSQILREIYNKIVLFLVNMIDILIPFKLLIVVPVKSANIIGLQKNVTHEFNI